MFRLGWKYVYYLKTFSGPIENNVTSLRISSRFRFRKRANLWSNSTRDTRLFVSSHSAFNGIFIFPAFFITLLRFVITFEYKSKRQFNASETVSVCSISRFPDHVHVLLLNTLVRFQFYPAQSRPTRAPWRVMTFVFYSSAFVRIEKRTKRLGAKRRVRALWRVWGFGPRLT